MPVFLDDSNKTKGIFAANRLVFSDSVGNAGIALRPSADGGDLILGNQKAIGLQISGDSSQAGLCIGGGLGSVTLKISRNSVEFKNGPAIELTTRKPAFSTRLLSPRKNS